jgi:hypothetical protein
MNTKYDTMGDDQILPSSIQQWKIEADEFYHTNSLSEKNGFFPLLKRKGSSTGLRLRQD